jgi:uncharacterized SAM-binding protein YcdF (DUF218 family)
MDIFFITSKILSAFLFPLPGLLLFGLFLSFRTRSGSGLRFAIRFVCLGLWLVSSYGIANRLVQSLEDKYPPVSLEALPQVDAVVVLGGMVNNLSKYPENTELNSAADRIIQTVRIFKSNKTKKVLFTGGSGSLSFQDRTEAEGIKNLLVDLGIPQSAILIEDKSRNTRENAVYSKAILQKENLTKIILVTSAFHMERALHEFHDPEIEIFPCPTDYRSITEEVGFWEKWIPNTGALETSTLSIKEWIGIFAYSWIP